MENVPKIVAERLRATSVVATHPDADLLAAFSEGLLPDRERNQILEHLACCSDCREIVVLAAPEDEPVAEVVSPVRGTWLTWPRLRWGLVAAGVIVVGAFGLQWSRSASHPADMVSLRLQKTDIAKEAKNEAPPLPASPVPAESAGKTASPAKESAVDSRDETDVEQSKQLDRSEPSARLEVQAPGSQTVGSKAPSRTFSRNQVLPHGPKPPAQWQQNSMYANSNNAVQSPAPPPPPPASTSSGKPELTDQGMIAAQTPPPTKLAPLGAVKKTQDPDNLAVTGRSIGGLEIGGASAGAEVARAKPAATPANAPAAKADNSYSVSETTAGNFSQTGSLIPQSVRWSINAAGGLQRSFDQGTTWEDVDVSISSAVSGPVNRQLALKSSHEQALAKDKADRKEAPIVFRAVAANGPDVWAGGSGGRLFHSSDSGNHWVPVVPAWRGIEMSGDIVSLMFADAQHGRIVTTAAEIWTTADGGQTWDKQ